MIHLYVLYWRLCINCWCYTACNGPGVWTGTNMEASLSGWTEKKHENPRPLLPEKRKYSIFRSSGLWCRVMLWQDSSTSGGSVGIQNVAILPQQYMASQTRRPWLVVLPLWKP